MFTMVLVQGFCEVDGIFEVVEGAGWVEESFIYYIHFGDMLGIWYLTAC